MTNEQFLQQFGHFIDAPNGLQKMRELILQLAVQGKLVSQDVSDELAPSWLAKFDAVDDVVALQGWKIVKFSDIFDIKGGSQPPKSQFIEQPKEGYVRLLQIRDFGPKPVPVYVPKDSVTKFCDETDVMMGRYGASVGKVFAGQVGAYNVALIKFIFDKAKIISSYVNVFLRSASFQSHILGVSRSAQAGFNKGDLANIPIAIPPTDEQHRIVAKVDELMALCDQLEAERNARVETHQRLIRAVHHPLTEASDTATTQTAWHRIRDNFADLYTTLESVQEFRQVILALAMKGKLISQEPTDEPAAVLLDKIRKQRANLVAEGKIKKIKQLPPLVADNAPYVLPTGWEWARFPELGGFGRGKSKHRPRNDPALYSGGTIPLVQTGDVARANGLIRTCTAYYNDKGLAQSYLWPAGTMCITIAANIADTGILSIAACFPDSVVGFIPSELIGNARYFEYFTRTAKERLQDFAPSTAQKNINLGILETVMIPLPPANEATRIVEKVDHLMALCDLLEDNIHDKSDTANRYAEAIVQQIAAA
ncbi:MAG: restriction endonuclease subunit S [gamma proteobacterium endosymbiont of Lamellibrachia anaximandri]|nr:restriction endonuclease subunit S [gamma proteobacterium endosymbiont of Lamellibrachia anaximandri]MBL3618149.1 restriction endonuclease subunit S [gamma proteobacterium endosymbiont of Lamellibrachia anaximandri]